MARHRLGMLSCDFPAVCSNKLQHCLGSTAQLPEGAQHPAEGDELLLSVVHNRRTGARRASEVTLVARAADRRQLGQVRKNGDISLWRRACVLQSLGMKRGCRLPPVCVCTGLQFSDFTKLPADALSWQNPGTGLQGLPPAKVGRELTRRCRVGSKWRGQQPLLARQQCIWRI